MAIHPTAVVASGAEIEASCEVGPYAVIGPHVRMGPGTTVGPHAVVEGHTTLGAGNRIFQFASVGAAPQDLKYRGEPTRLEIGDGNTFREFSSVHVGTDGGGGVTRIGDRCLIMANAHVAHDCRLGDRVILANCASLAGHVEVGDGAILGGLSAVHQFVRVGALAFVSGGAMVTMDVPPYCVAQGDRAQLAGLNTLGAERAGIPAESLAALRRAYRLIFREGRALAEALERAAGELGASPEVSLLVEFLRRSERGVTRPRG